MSGGVDSSRGRRPAAGGRPRGGRHLHAAPRPDGGARPLLRALLRARRPPRRAGGGGPARHPPLRRSTSSARSTTGVIAPFVRDYLEGRTPIPCARCNTEVKFDEPARADPWRWASTHVATGHYARRDVDPATGRQRLLKGRDPAKDQSYFLFGLSPGAARRRPLPGGRPAQGRGARGSRASAACPIADKAESQEICFVPDGDYAAFVERQAGRGRPLRPDRGRDGRDRSGRHGGVHRFTVGQRKGLGPLLARGRSTCCACSPRPARWWWGTKPSSSSRSLRGRAR